MILIDGSYDMVAEQEILKYNRPSGTDFGPVDPVKYAEAFGATGLMVRSPEQISSVLKQASRSPLATSRVVKFEVRRAILVGVGLKIQNDPLPGFLKCCMKSE